MGWFKRLFGEGKIKAVVTMDNGDQYDVKIPYEGRVGTLIYPKDRAIFERHIKNYCWVEFNKVVTKIEITGVY